MKKLPDQAALGAAENDASLIDRLHQIVGGFEGNQMLRITVNVNCHAVITRDNTVLTRDETLVFDRDLSDTKAGLARYAQLSLSGSLA